MSILIILVSFASVFTGPDNLPDSLTVPDNSIETKLSFSESLADYVNGIVIEQESEIPDGGELSSSVIWIPTYYGYHTILGVLDTYVHSNTTFTSLRTKRMADRNFYVIDLSEDEILIRIVYDSANSLLRLTMPSGY